MGLINRGAHAKGYYKRIGWGPVGYISEPLNTHPNDEYTARPMAGPFSLAWQGVQKRQEERYLDTTWVRLGISGPPVPSALQTVQANNPRYQQYGSYQQFAGHWGIVPATEMMTGSSSQIGTANAPTGLLANLVTAVKKAWNG